MGRETDVPPAWRVGDRDGVRPGDASSPARSWGWPHCGRHRVRHRDAVPTVLIVDDHEVFRASARALLEASGFDVIGEAGDGPRAVMAVAALRPQIVLLDIHLPGQDG